MSTLRVDPDYVEHVKRFLLNEETKSITWSKLDHDTHTLFEGSNHALSLVRAFIKGFEAAEELRKW